MSNFKSPLGFIILDSALDDTLEINHKIKDLAKDLNFSIYHKNTEDLDPSSPKLIHRDGKWQIFTRDISVRTSIDFLEPTIISRVDSKTINRENLVRAVRGRKSNNKIISVLDGTAGLGRDAFLLAASGCNVIAIENLKVIFFLLREALQRISSSGNKLSFIAERLQFKYGDSIDHMNKLSGTYPDVIYLDPMYSSSSSRGLKKTASTKKSIKILQDIYSYQIKYKNSNHNMMLKLALSIAKTKVVVKRPPNSDFLEGVKPASSLTGKTARFDIYPT